MADYFLLQNDGARDGPYSEEDLLDLLDADELSAGAVCLDTLTGRRVRVRDLFKVIPPAGEAEITGETAVGNTPPPLTVPTPGHSPFLKAPAAAEQSPEFHRWQPAPLIRTSEEDSLPRGIAAGRVCFRGHPSLLIYWRSLLLTIIFTTVSWFVEKHQTQALTAGLFVSLLLLISLFLRRAGRRYLVTTRHVERQDGLFSFSSQEVRLEDIRAISVTKSGLRGLLGVGTVEFSTAAGNSADVIFHDVSHAPALRELVRRLQDRVE